jgi:hypothetical protein
MTAPYLRERFNPIKPGEAYDAAYLYRQLQAIQRSIPYAPAVDVRDFSPRGNGEIDDTTALTKAATAAASNNMPLYIAPPEVAYAITSPLVWTDVPDIRGVPGKTIIQPSSAVGANPALTINNTVQAFGIGDWNPVVGITVDGVNNTTGTGVAFGTNALTSSLDVQFVRAINFTGAGGLGMSFGNLVDCEFHRLASRNNTMAASTTSTDVNMPTTCAWYSCNFRESTGTSTGFLLDNGYQLVFYRCTFESNAAYGVHVKTRAGGQITQVQFIYSWFESNWTGSGTPLTKFHLEVDGSLGGSNDVHVLYSSFNAANKSARFTSSANVLLKANSYPAISGTIQAADNAWGWIENDPHFTGADFTTLVEVVGTGNFRLRSQFAEEDVNSLGDAAIGVTAGTDAKFLNGVAALTANRIVTLNDVPNPGAGRTAKFVVLHPIADAFTYDVKRQSGTLLKSVASATWSEFYHDGTDWQYLRSGTT